MSRIPITLDRPRGPFAHLPLEARDDLHQLQRMLHELKILSPAAFEAYMANTHLNDIDKTVNHLFTFAADDKVGEEVVCDYAEFWKLDVEKVHAANKTNTDVSRLAAADQERPQRNQEKDAYVPPDAKPLAQWLDETETPTCTTTTSLDASTDEANRSDRDFRVYLTAESDTPVSNYRKCDCKDCIKRLSSFHQAVEYLQIRAILERVKKALRLQEKEPDSISVREGATPNSSKGSRRFKRPERRRKHLRKYMVGEGDYTRRF